MKAKYVNKAKKILKDYQINDQVIFDKNDATWRLSGLIAHILEENNQL